MSRVLGVLSALGAAFYAAFLSGKGAPEGLTPAQMADMTRVLASLCRPEFPKGGIKSLFSPIQLRVGNCVCRPKGRKNGHFWLSPCERLWLLQIK